VNRRSHDRDEDLAEMMDIRLDLQIYFYRIFQYNLLGDQALSSWFQDYCIRIDSYQTSRYFIGQAKVRPSMSTIILMSSTFHENALYPDY
jgi:hypothetical protein